MQPIIFAFTFNQETQQLTFASNIQPTKAAPMVALEILQKAVIAQAVEKAGDDGKKTAKQSEAAQEPSPQPPE